LLAGGSPDRANTAIGRRASLLAGNCPVDPNLDGTLTQHPTTPERIRKGDPRLSVRERYRSHAGYVARVTWVATSLANERLLLSEDVLRYIAKAALSPVGR